MNEVICGEFFVKEFLIWQFVLCVFLTSSPKTWRRIHQPGFRLHWNPNLTFVENVLDRMEVFSWLPVNLRVFCLIIILCIYNVMCQPVVVFLLRTGQRVQRCQSVQKGGFHWFWQWVCAVCVFCLTEIIFKLGVYILMLVLFSGSQRLLVDYSWKQTAVHSLKKHRQTFLGPQPRKKISATIFVSGQLEEVNLDPSLLTSWGTKTHVD